MTPPRGADDMARTPESPLSPRQVERSAFFGAKFIPVAVAAVIALGLALYAQVVTHGFVAWDDTSYVSENPVVAGGLGWSGVVWAFSDFQLSNWHPLTLLSHMLDVSLWGLCAGCHAATNAAIHVANSLLVFGLALRVGRLPGGRIAYVPQFALAVALLFVAHPLHVESVAWISERKDVLCAFFWLLAMHAYLGYAQTRAWSAYVTTSVFLICALMAKPMAVSLPLVLLIFDFWPLARLGRTPLPRLVVEKLPWFGMAALVAVLTMQAQTSAMPPLDLMDRIQIAVSAYGWYIEKTLWPAGLHFYYLTEGAWDFARTAVSAIAILAVSAVAWRLRERQPALLAGWAWFLLTLLPVVGFVKAGTQAWADRYAYMPHFGLFVAMVAVATNWAASRGRRQWLWGLFGVYLAGLAIVGERQVGVWRDTERLYQHALSEDRNHYVALMGLANLRLREGRVEEARQFAERALALSGGPGLVRAMNGVLGEVALRRGDLVSAISYLEKARDVESVDAGVVARLGTAYLRAGEWGRAEAAFREGIRRDPESVDARNGLAVVFGQQGRYADAEAQLRLALRKDPANRSLRHNLALVMIKAGDVDRAGALYRDLLRDYPDDVAARQGLARLNATSGG